MMRAGTARTDITPPIGTAMAAFPAAPGLARRATAVRDPLEVRALTLDDGTTRITVCACDLTLIDTWDVRAIRAIVEQAMPTPVPHRILIAATHTHASFEMAGRFEAERNEPLAQELQQRIAATILAASERLEEVSLATGTLRAALNHNRRVRGQDGRSRMIMEHDPRQTTGPVDEELAVLRLDARRGGTLAVLFNYSAHALTLGRENRSFSADYPGEARRCVETAFPGSMALFVNGAAGNLHPRQCMRPDDAALRWMGAALGAKVTQAAQRAGPLEPCGVRHTQAVRTFPNRMDPALSVDVEIHLIQIGSLCIGCLPGEVFVELQRAFKQAVAPRRAFLIGYANGWPGYIPPRAAYAEGGYGVDRYARDPAGRSRTCLSAGAGEDILETLLAMAAAG